MKTNKALVVLAFLLMISFGFIANIQGVIIPSVRHFFSISYENMGLLLLLASLGFAIATFIGGLAVDRFGQKKILFIGCIVLGLGMAIMPLVNSIYLFALSFFIINLGTGAIEIGVNSLGAKIFLSNAAVMMNFLHLFYGLGSTIGPRYAGLMLANSFNWQVIYLYTLVIIIPLIIFIIFSRFPAENGLEHHKSIPVKTMVKDVKMWLFAAVLGFAVVLELGIANWLVNFLREVRGMDENTSSLYLSYFFIAFTLGRLVGGYLAERIGYVKIILYFAICSIILFLAGLISDSKGALLFSLIGFFVSTMYPTVMAIIIREFKEKTAGAMGFISTSAVFVNMLSNWLIGKSNDLFGVFYGFSSIVIYTFLIIVFLLLLEKRLKFLQEPDAQPSSGSTIPM